MLTYAIDIQTIKPYSKDSKSKILEFIEVYSCTHNILNKIGVFIYKDNRYFNMINVNVSQ